MGGAAARGEWAAAVTADALTRRFRRIALAWALAMATIWGAAALVAHSPLFSADPGRAEAPPAIEALSEWDGSHYATIAENGYVAEGVERRHVAFFPLLPALARLLGGREHVRIAGILVSQISLLVALLLLVRLRPGEQAAAVPPLREEPGLWLLVSPLAFFFSVFYTESLFLLLSLLAYLGLRRRRWLLSWAGGLLAGLCRPTAVFLVPLFLGQAFADWRAGRRWKAPLALSFSPILGVGLYTGFVGYMVGDPLGYFSVQAGFWNQSWTVPFEPLVRDAQRFLIALSFGEFLPPDQTIRLFSAFGILALMAYKVDELEPSLIAFVLVSMLVIHSLEPRRSTARYELVLFPVYLLLARSPLARRHVAPIACSALALMQLVMLVRFLTGEWVA